MAPTIRAGREAYWREVLDRHAASGLSLRAFAACEKLSPNTLAYWKYRRLAKPAVRSATLVPVHVIDDGASCVRDIVIAIDGAHVSIPRGFDEEHLARVLSVLRRPC
jgi:hypothetical protein